MENIALSQKYRTVVFTPCAYNYTRLKGFKGSDKLPNSKQCAFPPRVPALVSMTT